MTLITISLKCNTSTNTIIINISNKPVNNLHEKNEIVSFINTSFSHDLLLNTHILFVIKANNTAKNQAIAVLDAVPNFNIWANK